MKQKNSFRNVSANGEVRLQTSYQKTKTEKKSCPGLYCLKIKDVICLTFQLKLTKCTCVWAIYSWSFKTKKQNVYYLCLHPVPANDCTS